MSNTKIISKSSGTMDVEYNDNNVPAYKFQLDKIFRQNKLIAKDFHFSKSELCLLISIDRIQSAMHVMNNALAQESSSFYNDYEDVVEDINSIQRIEWNLAQKLDRLKNNILKGEGYADNT